MLKPLISFILNHFSVDKRDKEGNTPLILAARRCQTEKVLTLLAKDADINATDNNGTTPLLWAVMCGQTEMVQLLLIHDADVNATDNNGNTPLIWAVMSGRAEMVRILLDNGADVDATNKNGLTALIVAARNGFFDGVKILQEHGVDISPVRELVLEYAVKEQAKIKAAELKAIQDAELKIKEAQQKYKKSMAQLVNFFGIGHDETGTPLTDTKIVLTDSAILKGLNPTPH